MEEKKTTVFPTKKEKLKKTLTGMIAIVLVAVISVLATLAYLGTNTDETPNTFTGSTGIGLKLVEPDWKSKLTGNNETEETRAGSYSPNGEYLKNPMLYNSTQKNNPEEWVAMKVSFKIDSKYKDTDGERESVTDADLDNLTWEELQKIATIQYDSTPSATATYTAGFNLKDWELIWTSTKKNTIGTDTTLGDTDVSAIFIYKTPIVRNTESSVTDTSSKATYTTNSITNPLFNRIKIKTQKELADNGYYENNREFQLMPYFKIVVQGSAIKNEEVSTITNISGLKAKDSTTWDNVVKELVELLGETVS